MVKRRLFAFVVLGLVIVACHGVVFAEIKGKQSLSKLLGLGPGETPKPTPDAIQVNLKLDRDTYLLGESIAVDYEMTNVGKKPAPYFNGSYYPDLRINNTFRMSAIKLDESDKPIGEAVATWPMPMNTGGLISDPKLKPNETQLRTLFVTRYVHFMEPGRYRLRIENIDPSQHVVYSSGETILTLKQPTPQEARVVYERMKRAPRTAWDDNAMRFIPDAADFETMCQPVYLPLLKEFVGEGDLDAAVSLEKMQSLPANTVLVGAIADALDRNDWQSARVYYQHLKRSLPHPNWFQEPLNEYDKADREHVARTWKADFGPVLTALARRLNVEVTAQMQARAKLPADADAKDPEFLERAHRGMFPQDHPQSLLGEINFIYNCLGSPEDFADCLQAFASSIELTKTLPMETHQYFRPRGSAYGFHFAVSRIMQRGALTPTKPTHPGEAAALIIALRTQADFRPLGWQAEVLKWLKHENPYLKELILDYFPEPIPAEVLDYLPTALADDYIDLQIAACHIAEKNPREAYRAPLAKILETATDKYLRKFAVDAARANGIKADYDKNAPFVR